MRKIDFSGSGYPSSQPFPLEGKYVDYFGGSPSAEGMETKIILVKSAEV